MKKRMRRLNMVHYAASEAEAAELKEKGFVEDPVRRADPTAQEAASVRSRELGNVGFFGAENLTGQVNGGKEIKVTYTADTVSGFGGLKWKLAVDGSSRVVRPVEWIRKIRAASEVIAEIGG